MRLLELQKKIYENKKVRGFNITDVGKEVVLMVEELGELAQGVKNKDKVKMVDAIGDLIVYCLGLCEILGVNAEKLLGVIVRNNCFRKHTGYME